jgi:hypothetical protein
MKLSAVIMIIFLKKKGNKFKLSQGKAYIVFNALILIIKKTGGEMKWK